MSSAPKLHVPNLGQVATAQPTTDWVTLSNYEPGYVYILIPSAGTLSVFYEYVSTPAAQIYVYHSSGTNTPINPGENDNIPVAVNDVIVYQLTNPGTDSVKVGYSLT